MLYTTNAMPIVGIEIETTLEGENGIERGKTKIRNALANHGIDYCTVKKDDTTSSATVFEIVLPPMAKGTFLRNQLAIIQTALESINAVITDKCGGHVHFGIEWLDTNLQSTEDFNLAQISHVRNNNNGFYASNKKDPMPFELMKNVGYRYGLNQQLINGILPNSRTNNTYCKPIDRQINSRDWKNATDIRTLDRIIGGKFYSVNYSNASATSSRKTIEFRQHSGSIEATKICNWIELLHNLYKTTDQYFLQYQNDLSTSNTPEQPYRQGTRLGQIWELCRTNDGATVQDLMMATGTTRSNIAGRISEMRSRFGDSAIVTGTQQSNGRSYGSGDEFASYKILKTFTSGANEVVALPANRAGNPSIWSDVSDDLFEYFNTRAQRFSR
jgi:hypothetical protein